MKQEKKKKQNSLRMCVHVFILHRKPQMTGRKTVPFSV